MDKGAIRRAAKGDDAGVPVPGGHADDKDLQDFAYGSLDARRINNTIALPSAS